MSDIRILAALSAERNYLNEVEDNRRSASMLAYGHAGAYMPSTSPRDDDRARRMIDAADRVHPAEEHPDSELFTRAAGVLSAIKKICDEPLDERAGAGVARATREGQFLRVDWLLREFPKLPTPEEVAEHLAALHL